MKKGLLALALGGLGLLAAGSNAQADSIVIKLVGGPVASGPNWNYTYDVTLDGNVNPAGQNVVFTSDFATLYDIQGFVSLSTLTGLLSNPLLFTPLVAPVTPHPGGTLPNDTGLPNIEFTYIGGAPIFGGVLGVDLGTFVLTSTLG